MQKVAIDFIPEEAPYQVVLFKNDRHGVYDFARNSTKAAGMSLEQATDLAQRLNYRQAWGA